MDVAEVGGPKVLGNIQGSHCTTPEVHKILQGEARTAGGFVVDDLPLVGGVQLVLSTGMALSRMMGLRWRLPDVGRSASTASCWGVELVSAVEIGRLRN